MKLNMKKAQAIRSLYATRNHSIPSLADRYGVSDGCIRSVITNRSFYSQDWEANVKELGFDQPKLREMIPQILEMRSQGMSFCDIGKQLAQQVDRRKGRERRAYSASSVRDALKRYGEQKCRV